MYTPTTTIVGIQPIGQAASTGTVNHALGTIVTAYDSTFGAGEFIYLYGVAANTVGSMVTYDALTGITTLVTGANLGAPVAVSMNANTSTTTGSWYQISGAAVIKKTAVAFTSGVKVFISATAGRVKAVASAGLEVVNCVAAAAATTTVSTVTCSIQRPFGQGQIT